MVTEITRIKLPGSESLDSLSLTSGYEPLPFFVAGPENRIAVPVLKRLLDNQSLPAQESCNPIVLTGTTGTGKSFLARAFIRHWSQLLGTDAVSYFSAVDFARELRDARNSDSLEEFEQIVSELRFLVIEDLSRLPSSSFIQSELRDLIDALVEKGSQVIFTSSRPPSTLANLEPGLRDRLSAGLNIVLRTPSRETREELLKISSELRGLNLDIEKLQALSHRLDGSAMHVLQALNQNELGSEINKDSAQPLELKSIIAVVARYFSLTQAALRSSARRKSLVYARSVVVYLARSLTKLSYAEIGRGLGGRDHTTIMHAQQNVEKLRNTDLDTQRTLEDLHRILSAD